MKKGVILALVVILVILGIFFVPRLVHTCDDCDKFFIGTGYEPSALESIISSDQDVICKECAEEQHALATTLGKSLKDFKKSLFD